MEIKNLPAKVNEKEIVAELKAAHPRLQFAYLGGIMEIKNLPAKVNEKEIVAELKAAHPRLQFAYLGNRSLTKPDNSVEQIEASIKVASLDGSEVTGQEVAAVRQTIAAHAPAKSDDEIKEANAKARADAIIAKILAASPDELVKLRDALAAL